MTIFPDPLQAYKCKSGEHHWVSEDKAQKCCGGWIPVWKPCFPEPETSPENQMWIQTLVLETDSESLLKYRPVLGYRDDPKYVEPFNRNLVAGNFNLTFSDVYRHVPLFLMKGLASSAEYCGASENELLSAGSLFLQFANTIERERILWEDVDELILEKYVEANPGYSPGLLSSLRNVFNIWKPWFEDFLDALR